ncbi:MAG: lysophospholipid acyltransferase family protein, partial [Saprospiraceae bacterium]|nr:lysophospholipid acyltransferase family protein [Saprospiraceae bacterium]
MASLSYYITVPVIYAISWLPFSILYLLSDCMFLVLYRILGYRKEVVHSNLTNSFPEKSKHEIIQIQEQFYRYFCDLILETIKTLSISREAVLQRISFDDTSAFAKFYERKQSVVIVMGHLGNWELAGARFSQIPYHQLFVIYRPLANRYFDQLMYHMRTRLGNKLYAAKDAVRGMVQDKHEITATAFIADQTPSPKAAYWTTFLNQETPVFTGTAKISKMLRYPIIYMTIKRLKRGYYKMTSEILVEDPSQYTEDEISALHTKRLEKDICQQ